MSKNKDNQFGDVKNSVGVAIKRAQVKQTRQMQEAIRKIENLEVN